MLHDNYTIVIFADEINSRHNFVIKHVFSLMGLKPLIISNKEEFANCNLPRINYSTNRMSNEILIKPYGILSQKGIIKQEIPTNYYKGLPVIFCCKEGSDFPFDIFSAVFYLITRYEEYLDFKPDDHGRFSPQESVAYKAGFLDTPIVEKWIEIFKDFLLKKYNNLQVSSGNFRYIPTIDVDSAFSFKNKGFILSTALICRDLLQGQFSNLKQRLSVIFNFSNDPFNNFDFIFEKLKISREKPIFFFQAGERGRYDKNNSIRSKGMKKLIEEALKVASVGIHPSYESNKSFELFDREKTGLEKAIGQKVNKSRQHYLKLLFPQTYNNLIKAEVFEDYSLGYASEPGFRAGTCNPYNFYNLITETETDLKVIPFQLMDTTFKSYLKISIEEAGKIMIDYYNKVKKVNGTLVIIWHNDSFSPDAEGEKWRLLFQNMLEL